jgi:hypothetical protein
VLVVEVVRAWDDSAFGVVSGEAMTSWESDEVPTAVLPLLEPAVNGLTVSRTRRMNADSMPVAADAAVAPLLLVDVEAVVVS